MDESHCSDGSMTATHIPVSFWSAERNEDALNLGHPNKALRGGRGGRGPVGGFKEKQYLWCPLHSAG